MMTIKQAAPPAWLFALILVTRVPVAGAQIIPQLPVLPPLSNPVSVSLTVVVQSVGDDRFEGDSFESLQVAGTIQLVDTYGQPFDWGGDAAIHATGGAAPALRFSGFSTGGATAGGNGRVNYLFEVRPLDPLVQGSGPIPVLIFASGGADVSIGSPSTSGTVQAELWANTEVVGFYALDVFQGTVTSEVNSFTSGFPLTVTAFDLNGVLLKLSAGIGDDGPHTASSLDAFVDPYIYIDPAATFEHEGQTLRYIDHYGIAYSPGVEQWQPETAIFADGFEALVAP